MKNENEWNSRRKITRFQRNENENEKNWIAFFIPLACNAHNGEGNKWKEKLKELKKTRVFLVVYRVERPFTSTENVLNGTYTC